MSAALAACVLVLLVATTTSAAPPESNDSAGPPVVFPVKVAVEADKPVGPLTPIWRFFGADEPNYAYMKDGQTLLAELGKLGRPDSPVYFRAHNLLNTGDTAPALKWGSTNVYTEDADGNPVYDWTTVDRIFDAYLAGGVRPFVELGFMPEALSTHPEPYQHQWRPGRPYDEIITGWAYPPKSYDKWRELCYQLAKHCVDRYGEAEVATWYFECWNEAEGAYWKGTRAEWFKLHDYAIDGVRRALPTARVGGPHAANGGSAFFREFLQHATGGTNEATGGKGSPLDFVAFHAKGAPNFVDGHVRMGVATHLKNIDAGFKAVAAFPALRDTPIVIGESDPEGCAACQGPSLGYRNGTMYSSYTAATFPRKILLAERAGVNLRGALTWAFTFENQAYFAGFRQLASNGVDLPVLNVFRMFDRMRGNRVAATSDGQTPLNEIVEKGVRSAPDVGVMATAAGDGGADVLLWHYHDDDLPGPNAAVEVSVSGLGDATSVSVTEYRVDEFHSNAYAVWKRMGSPAAPDVAQRAQLLAAGRLAAAGPAVEMPVTGGKLTLRTSMPRQAVVLFVVERR